MKFSQTHKWELGSEEGSKDGFTVEIRDSFKDIIMRCPTRNKEDFYTSYLTTDQTKELIIALYEARQVILDLECSGIEIHEGKNLFM